MSQQRHNLRNSTKLAVTLVLIGGAFFAAFYAAVNIAGGKDLLGSPFRLALAAGVFSISMIAVFAGVFAATLRPNTDSFWDARLQMAASGAFLAAVDALILVGGLDRTAFVIFSAIGQSVFAYSSIRFIVTGIQLSGPWQTLPPWIATVCFSALGLIAFVFQTWIPLQSSLAWSGVAREVISLAGSFALLAAMAFSGTLRIPNLSSFQSIRFRFMREGQPTDAAIPVLFAIAASAIALPIMLSLDTNPPQIASFAGIAAIILSIRDIAKVARDHQQSAVTSRLTTIATKRFLARHLNERPAWAATVGLRTSNFLIDHDPANLLQDELPATFIQIRAEELQRCINDVLGKKQLHQHTVGHRIYGAIDPESSVRPCVDILKLMSCLYLDAGPLIERRLKGLAQLLPIVDPGLARILDAEDVSRLIKRNQWFFHLDYGWVDQHVVHTPATTRYGVQMGSTTSESSESMLSLLRKRSGLGNFIWIGFEARERLLQEAPVLSSIIEAHPLTQDGSNRDLLVFTIKFEQLIPRLQRYYNLDLTRKVLLDFDPSPESTKLLGIFGMQLAQAKDTSSVQGILDSITAYPWRGFKEKDSALRLVIEAHKFAVLKSTETATSAEAVDAALENLKKRLMRAVEQVGYPSQILHNAQINKIALRDINKLMEAAAKPSNNRFHEAWMLLSTADAKRYKNDERQLLLEFLGRAPTIRAIAENSFVQNKAIDALCSLARASNSDQHTAINGIINSFLEWFISKHSSPDTLNQMLDAMRFLKQQSGVNTQLAKNTEDLLNQTIENFRQSGKSQDSQIVALTSRWQELQGNRPSTTEFRIKSAS